MLGYQDMLLHDRVVPNCRSFRSPSLDQTFKIFLPPGSKIFAYLNVLSFCYVVFSLINIEYVDVVIILKLQIVYLLGFKIIISAHAEWGPCSKVGSFSSILSSMSKFQF